MEIPSSVTEIGQGAFTDNPHIEVVKVNKATPPILGADGFHLITYASASLKVPVGSEINYKRAAEWSNFQYINPTTTGIGELPEDAQDNSKYYDLFGRPATDATKIKINTKSRKIEIK